LCCKHRGGLKVSDLEGCLNRIKVLTFSLPFPSSCSSSQNGFLCSLHRVGEHCSIRPKGHFQCVFLSLVTGSLFNTGRKKHGLGGMGHFVSDTIMGRQCGLKVGHTMEAAWQNCRSPHLGKIHYFSVQGHCLFSE